MQQQNVSANRSGFTLIELLIVLGILAILAIVIIIVVNPVELLKKTRDTQRLSDAESVTRALTYYVTTSKNPDLDGPNFGPGNPISGCFNKENEDKRIFYSLKGE